MGKQGILPGSSRAFPARAATQGLHLFVQAKEHRVKLGEVLKNVRERGQLTEAQVASKLNLTVEEYRELESGESPAETWAPYLAEIAIVLEVPTSRLVSKTGRFVDVGSNSCGQLIKANRLESGKAIKDLADRLAMSRTEFKEIEKGNSPLETYGPLFLRFAEIMEQPLFNIFYPSGVAYRDLKEYP